MNDLKHFIREIHRRSLWQVVAIYSGGSWLALQVVREMTLSLGLPDWVPPAALALLVIGFPVVVATAFVQEGGPEMSAGKETVETPGTRQPPRLGEGEPEERGPFVERILTWSNAILGGLAAFALLGVGTAGYLTMRTMGVGPPATLIGQGTMEQGDTLVLADFAGVDSITASTMTEAIRVDLEQSPALTLFPPDSRREALRRMERDPASTLSLDIARELAQREGLKAVIGGSIQPAGDGYVLTARLVGSESGEALISERETAGDDGEVVNAIARLSRKLRERMGESLTSIRTSQPLQRVTTSSLEALKIYTRGAQAYARESNPEAASLLERAVRLDTSFAYAYRKLGVALTALGRQGEARDAFRRAYAHRDRLPAYERTQTVGSYHLGQGDLEAAAAEYEAHLIAHPRESRVLNNLAHAYLNQRRYDTAETIALRLIEERPDDPGGYRIATAAQVAKGELRAASATAERMEEALPNHPSTRDHLSTLAHNRGDHVEAESVLLESLRDEDFRAWNRAEFLLDLARLRATRGRLAEADSLFRLGAELREPSVGPSGRVGDALDRGRLRLFGSGDTTGALTLVTTAVDGVAGDSIGPWNLPYVELAAFTAMASDTTAASEYLARRQRASDAEQGLPVGARLWRQVLSGSLALIEERPRDAVERFRAALEVPASIACGGEACVLPLLARAHRVAGARDAELRTLRRFTTGYSQFRLEWDALFLGPALERLGELHEERNDVERAVDYYRRFLNLWEDADPELQPRVEAVRERIVALSAETSADARH